MPLKSRSIQSVDGQIAEPVYSFHRLHHDKQMLLNLELFLYPECEKDDTGEKQIQSSIFASVFFGNATGVNDLADNNLLSVSPNPTSGWLQISLPAGNSLETVRVMDLSGKTVRNLERGASASNTEIDLSGLPKGIYVLQARSEGQVFVKKVIVE